MPLGKQHLSTGGLNPQRRPTSPEEAKDFLRIAYSKIYIEIKKRHQISFKNQIYIVL
jgi:hypothetical protein